MGQMMQLRASLIESKPEVWRRLLVDPRLTLGQLHTVLQYAFGWTDSHLHQFHAKDGTRYVVPTLMDGEVGVVPGSALRLSRGGRRGAGVRDERKVLLAEVFDRRKKVIVYEYDFGDSWMHVVRFEGLVNPEEVEYPFETFVVKGKGYVSGKPRAAICIAGERNGPPEDCGGIYGFQRVLELKAAPPHPTSPQDADDREILDWLGDWDPALVDLAEINQFIGRVRVKKAYAQ